MKLIKCGWLQAPKKEKAPPPSSKPAKSGGGKQKKKVLIYHVYGSTYEFFLIEFSGMISIMNRDNFRLFFNQKFNLKEGENFDGRK